MKKLLLWIGIITLVISLSHGFITGQSVTHSLLVHPLLIILSLGLIAFGLSSSRQEAKKLRGFRENISPYINEKLASAERARLQGDFETEFKYLEDAHVLGQRSTYFHTLVHWRMFVFGWRQSSLKEMFGQTLRLVGALTKTFFGLLPTGNTGGSNVSAFKPMPISKENQVILDKVNNA